MSQIIRIACWNIACAAGEQYRCKQLDAMIAALAEARADIILLQEVDRYAARSGNRDITQEIALELGMHQFFAPALDGRDGSYGNAVLSRFPIVETHALALGPGLDHSAEKENRSAAYVILDVNGKSLHVISTHLASTFGMPSPYRVAQMALLSAIIRENTDIAALIGGDFNVEPDSPDMAVFDSILENATPGIGPTCSLEEGHPFAYQIDRIYACGLTSQGTDKKSYPGLSDHCLILADVSLG